MRRSLIGLALVPLGLAWGSAAQAVTVKQVHDGLVRYISKSFQKPKGLKVKVETFDDPKALQEGRLKIIHVTLSSAEFEGVAMHDLSLKAYDIKVLVPALLEETKLITNHAKNTVMHARLTEQEVNEALKTKKMPIEDFKVDFQKGKLLATGVYRVGISNRLKMIAHLEPKKDGVYLVAERIWINGLPLPLGQLKKVIDKMNPLINLERLPFHPRAKSIKIGEKEIEVN